MTNCIECEWMEKPVSVRRSHCIECSKKFVSNAKIRNGTNELSNKGRTFVSYDNHGMADDRDVVADIDKEYLRGLKSSANGVHPVIGLAKRMGVSMDKFAELMYERTKRFIYELTQLSDIQVLYFISKARGDMPTSFAKAHKISDSAVTTIHHQVVARSELFETFIRMMRGGTLEGTRGRKRKTGTAKAAATRKCRKIVYVGTEQLEMDI